jgi:pyruvate dehydrogenase E2 component (dihydrolipoamide acetyltransferase)
VNTLVAVYAEPGQDWKTVSVPSKSSAPAASAAAAAPKPATPSPAPAAAAAAPAASHSSHGSHDNNKVRFPSVKRLLHEYGLDAASVKGSGRDGLLLKGDVLAAINQRQLKPVKTALPPASASPAPSAAAATPAPAAASKPQAAAASTAAAASGRVKFEDIPTTNMRRVIADRLTASKTQVPHAYATRECEIDSLMSWRKKLNEQQSDAKLSVNDFVIRAAALALRDVPEANVTWDSKTESVQKHSNIDISIAVALESGLITPIIKAANTKGFVQIATEMKDLATRARAGKLALNEFQGGTFSISNLGMYGIAKFSAVINPPQAMILAVGGSQQRVVFDEKSGSPKTVTKMAVTLSFDSRSVDEEIAAKWLAAFEKYISDPVRMLL